MTTPIKSLIQTMRELREKATAYGDSEQTQRWRVSIERGEYNQVVGSMDELIANHVPTLDLCRFIAAAPVSQERLEKALEIAVEDIEKKECHCIAALGGKGWHKPKTQCRRCDTIEAVEAALRGESK